MIISSFLGSCYPEYLSYGDGVKRVTEGKLKVRKKLRGY